MARCYIRNGVWGWPLEAQEKALRDAGVFDAGHLYRDEMSAARAKKPSHILPEWLEDRGRMLKPTGRRGGEIIYFATWPVIAVSEADLIEVLAAAEKRRATLVAVDSGASVVPGDGLAGATLAKDAWQKAKREAMTRPGRAEGNRIAAQRRRERTLAKAREAYALWRSTKPDRLTTAEIADRVGLSVRALYKELGRRPDIKKGRSK